MNTLAGPQPPFVLVYDIGSSSTRTLLFDRVGHALEGTLARAEYALRATPEGGVEADADELLARLAECLDGTLALAGPRAADLVAVAGDTLVSNLLGLDADGRPITPLYTYSDTRCDADATALRAQFDEAAVQQRTGCMLRTGYWPAQLAWLARTRPDVVRRVQRWSTLGDYVLGRLFERADIAVSYSAASWTGLLNRRTFDWDEDWLTALGLPREALPPLAGPEVMYRGLAGAWAQRWPALRAAPWFPPIGDGAAANVGSGCIGPGQIALTIGTTGAMRTIRPAEDVRPVPRGLWEYRVDRHRALLGGALSEGGNLLAWLRAALRLPDEAALEAQLAERAPDEHGLTVLPFIAGERSPGWAGDASASVVGLRASHGAVDIYQAAAEAIAYRVALVHELLAGEVRGPAPSLIASGGALLRSRAWMQIMADVLNRPLTASAETESAARGTALLALESLGLLKDLAEAQAAMGQTFHPREARHEWYARAMERQKKLYDDIIRGAGQV